MRRDGQALRMRIAELLSANGDVLATHELAALGVTAYELHLAVATGEILRPRRGWYCSAGLSAVAVQAIRVGGRLGCTSAAAHHGLWTRGSRLHVDVPRNAARLRDPHQPRRIRAAQWNPRVHWAAYTGSRITASPIEALAAMCLCEPPERVVAAVDSALRFKRITVSEWAACTSQLPRRLRDLIAGVDARSESITESVMRFRLRALGIHAWPQQRIAGVGRVDFVIGDRLIIEVDGRAYHSDPKRFEADRSRDARASARGFRVLRFSYKQVFERWSEVRAAIVASMARGDHLRSVGDSPNEG